MRGRAKWHLMGGAGLGARPGRDRGGKPAQGAGEGGLLRWLSPLSRAAASRVEPPMEAEASDAPPGRVEAALSCFSFNQDCT